MKLIDRLLITSLVAGVWALVCLQLLSNEPAHAQDQASPEKVQNDHDRNADRTPINATEIVGLTALIEKTLRQQQVRATSIGGLDQHIRSVVRGCRVNGGTTGGRISNASISC
jgi:hypothetical protein